MELVELTADHEQVLAFIKRMHAECMADIKSCTIPFYVMQNGGPVQYGSGVLLEIADKHFVLTAAHVMDICQKHESPTYVSSGNVGDSLIQFEDFQSYLSSMPEGGSREDDPFDISVSEIPEVLAQNLLGSRRFVRLADIDPRDKQRKGGWYFVFGYPSIQTVVNMDAAHVNSTGLAYGTVLYGDDRGDLRNDDRRVQIVIDFLKQGNTDDNQNLVIVPRPNGISGCGIWRLAHGGASVKLWKPEDKRLVGIEHTWNKDKQVLRGTRIEYALQINYRHYPSLRRAMHLNHDPLLLKW